MSYQIQYETYPAVKRSKNNLIHSGLNADSINVDGWHLPGFQEKRDYCGQWGFFGCMNIEKHLDHKIFLKPFQKSCFRADCEKCCFKWLGREASKSTRRMMRYQKDSKRMIKHIIVSVPKWDYYKPKKELAKKVRKILKEVKADSGLIIFHPFRLDKKNDLWYYSPHFHILGFGWVEAVAEAYNKYGYVVKNLGKRDTVFGTIYYQLSHCGVKKKFHALTYFGDVSYRNKDLNRQIKLMEKEEKNKKCPLCNADLQELTPKYVSNHSCELKPDPIIMTVDYMIDFYDWVLKSSY